ncbi:hypothetical protein HW555_013253 [Spodoptera exigua]|uniref:Uncharacterized protein n=1 Tax=Spodoptera exigua TaxID=7107 RepID=A0A835G3Q4_SPOEX|nr:hypothetical protein HW555_013253 [Spodoptera exigua]
MIAQEEDVPVVAVGSSSGPTTEQGQDEVNSPEVPQASSLKPAESFNIAKENIIEIVPSACAEVKDVNLDDVSCWPSPMTDEVKTLLQRGLSVDMCAQKLCALKTLLVESRDRFVQEAIDFAKTLCEKLGIELKTRRIRRKKRTHGDESSEDAALSHEQEIRRELFASFDKIIQEMTTRFQQIQEISDKFGFLMPAKLLDSNFECDLSNVLEDIDKDEFQMERKRLQQFVACSESEGDISDDEVEELLKVNDLWSFFDTDGRKTQCIICKEATGNNYEEIKAHMKENHPKVMLQMMQFNHILLSNPQEKENSDATSNEDDAGGTYTEVVYLEQEPSPETVKIKEKPKLPKAIMKRRRTSVFENFDSPPKRTKAIENDSDELMAFVKYITCLLKKLPPDVFSNVQIEIINTILRANSQTTVLINKDLPSTSNTLLNFEGNNSLSPNYTITVAQKTDNNETDNNT